MGTLGALTPIAYKIFLLELFSESVREEYIYREVTHNNTLILNHLSFQRYKGEKLIFTFNSVKKSVYIYAIYLYSFYLIFVFLILSNILILNS